MVGLGGTCLRWQRAVPDAANLHESVYERLAMPKVRNFVSCGPYHLAALAGHVKAKKFYAGENDLPRKYDEQYASAGRGPGSREPSR
jgi:hypothetical protein